MGKHTGLYTVCLILFPVAFAGFVVGFGCPVWIARSNFNSGLWQTCSRVFKDCSTLDFDQGGDWMIGVRAVEIFALVMLAVTAAELAYENCCSDFSRRKSVERVAPAIICVLGGLGGLAGVIVYAVKRDGDIKANGSDLEYGWAFMLVAAGSGLAVLVGIGFCASGVFLETTEDSDKTPINPYGNPYLSSSHGADSFEMSGYTNKALVDGPGDRDRDPRPLPPLALYNGLARHSLSSPLDLPPQEPPYYSRAPASLPPGDMKSLQYYPYSGDDGMHPQFDLSEGYLPSNSRPRAPASDSYYVRGDFRARGEDPYGRGGRRMEDPYAARGGDGGGFSDLPRLHAAGRGGEGRGYDAYDDRRENFYRSARY